MKNFKLLNSNAILNAVSGYFPITNSKSLEYILFVIESGITKGIEFELDFLKGQLLIATKKKKLQLSIITRFDLLKTVAEKMKELIRKRKK